MQHLPGMADLASAVHADDLLYLCSIFLGRKLMLVPTCYIDITGHLHALHWHELPFQDDAT
jgi:hypothetical protein